MAEALGRLVGERNDRTLLEYADRLEAETGVRAAPSMLCRALKRLGLPRKKDPARGRAGVAAVERARAACGAARPSPGSPRSG